MSEKTGTSGKEAVTGIETDSELQQALQEQKLMDKAANYLAYKPRTRQELRKYLRERGASAETVDRCLATMEEYHLIDDLEYSRMYIESMLQRGRGLVRIRRELRTKGVEEDVIEDALHQMEELPDEYEMALEQAYSVIGQEDIAGMDHHEKQKLMARLAGRLGRKGYPAETVYRAVRTALAEREQQQKEEREL